MWLNPVKWLSKAPLTEESVDLFRYRADIDGLRAIAILAVMLYHLNAAWLPGGFTGVDIFFVISGYVVTASLIKRNKPSTITKYLLSFYSRRIRRILPALFVCILITTLLASILIEPSYSRIYMRSALYSLIGASNVHFAHQQKGYFDSDQELDPFLHTWSLGVEEQFYLLFPLILFLASKTKALIPKRIGNITIIFVAILTLAVFVSMHLTLSSPIEGYYLMPSRFWELASGATLFIAFANGYRIAEGIRVWCMPLLQILAVGFLGISLLMTQSTWSFPFPWALPAVISSVLLLTIGVDRPTFLSNLLSNPQLVFIGKISYSLYLWHWSIFTMFRWSFGLDRFVNYFMAVLITVSLSLLSYYCIEKPIRGLNSLSFKRVFKNAGLALLAAGITILILYRFLAGSFYVGATLAPYDWKVNNLTGNFQCGPFWYENKLYEKVADHNSCSINIPNTKRIYMLGDSFAESLIPMLKGLVEKRIVSATALTHESCQVTPSLRFSMTDRFEYRSCFQFSQDEIEHAISSSQPGDVLFLAYLTAAYIEADKRYHDFSFSNKNGERITYSEARSLLKKDLITIARRLEQKGASLVVLAPLPMFSQPAKTCASWLSKFNQGCKVEKTALLSYIEPLTKVLKELEKDLPNFYIWSPFDELCPDSVCLQFRNGKALFKDTVHLSLYGSASLTDHFIHLLAGNRLAGQVTVQNSAH